MAAKGIEIRVATVGTQQAATEITKVADAMGSSSQGLGGASKKTGEQLGEFRKEGDKVTASSASMRFGLQNVGYQVQDFAVQVQSGTSATRAFSQQAPQLLSAFGPWGVALGTVVALGAPLIPMLMGQADNAEAVADAFDASAKKMADVIAKQESASWKEFVKQLDDETEAIKRNNEALGRKKELTEAIEAANKKLDDARQKAVKDEIDADPNMSDADKIRAKGSVDDAAARKAAAAEIKKLEDAAKAAEAEKVEKVKAAEDASNDTDETRARVGSDAEEIARLEKRKADVEKNRRTAEQQLPQAEKDAKWLYAKKYLGTGLPGDAERSEKSQAADLRVTNLKSMANDQMTPEQEARLVVLKKAQADQEAELKRREDAEKAAREAANKAGLDAENKQAILTETAPKISEAYQVESGSRRAVTESRAAEAERRAAAREKAKQDAEQRKADAAQRKAGMGVSAEWDGPGIAADAARASRSLGLEGKAKQLERLGNEIARSGNSSKMGTDDQILNKIVGIMENILEYAPNKGKGADQGANDMRKIMQRLDNIEGQVKGNRTGK
jgi:hypothetical protein